MLRLATHLKCKLDFRFICGRLHCFIFLFCISLLHSWQFLTFTIYTFVCGNTLQGVSSFGGRSSQKSLGAPSYLSWPLSRPEKKHQNFVYRQKTFKGAILAEAGKQGWDFGRFIKTLYFFNGPPSPAKVGLSFPFPASGI